MTREQANELLESLKNGADAPQPWINAALALTGDIQSLVENKNNEDNEDNEE